MDWRRRLRASAGVCGWSSCIAFPLCYWATVFQWCSSSSSLKRAAQCASETCGCLGEAFYCPRCIDFVVKGTQRGAPLRVEDQMKGSRVGWWELMRYVPGAAWDDQNLGQPCRDESQILAA